MNEGRATSPESDARGARRTSGPAISAAPRAPRTALDLSRSFFRRRSFVNLALTLGLWGLALLASVPLFSVLYMLISRGGARLGLATLTELPPAGFMQGGGIANAIIGTLVMVGIAALISVPFGILGGVFLGVVMPNSRTAHAARFVAKVLTGFPSILAGVFVFGVLVLAMGTYSAIAGGVALAVGMVSTVILTAEQAVRMVPQRMRTRPLAWAARLSRRSGRSSCLSRCRGY